MRAHLVTRPMSCFTARLLLCAATLIVLGGTLALVLAPLSVKAASGTAFVRVNQMGLQRAALF